MDNRTNYFLSEQLILQKNSCKGAQNFEKMTSALTWKL